MLGNHGLKPPAVTRQHNNCFAWVITQQEVPIRNTELISYCQKERVHQPITCPAKPPETFMLKPIVAEGRLHSQGLWVRPNRANKQEDWPEKTQKANPITIKPETTAMWQISSPGFPYLAALYLGPPSAIKSLCQHNVPPLTFPSVNESPLLDPGSRSPFL